MRPAWENVLEVTFGALIDMEAATLFSLLFGVGFALQMQRAGTDPTTARCYMRRLLLLLIIGLAHALLWWGDILRYYAVLGLLLVELGNVKRATLAWAGLLVALYAQTLLRP